jgi:hypothetical protein
VVTSARRSEGFVDGRDKPGHDGQSQRKSGGFVAVSEVANATTSFAQEFNSNGHQSVSTTLDAPAVEVLFWLVCLSH